MNVEKLCQLIQKEDSKENYIFLNPDDLTIHLKDARYNKRVIGELKEVGNRVVYIKPEKEANIYRKLKAWSINRIVLNAVDQIICETDKATYSISARDAILRGSSDSWDRESTVDRKIFIPIKYWDIKWKNASTERLVSLFGYEWYMELEDVINKEYILKLTSFMADIYSKYTVYPSKENVFLPFQLTSFMDVKVVIVAPYAFNISGSNGLAFGYEGNYSPINPTKEFFNEIKTDIYQNSLMFNSDFSMRHYAEQGVLLLNRIATACIDCPTFHQGWEEFTADIISILSTRKENLVFMLFDKAEVLKDLINTGIHKLLINGMPGTKEFIKNNQFSECNKYLMAKKILPINW